MEERSSQGGDHDGKGKGAQACPPHGGKSVCGRRPRMEDAYTAYPFLVQVPVPPGDCPVTERLPPRLATQHREADSSPPASENGASDPEDASGRSRVQVSSCPSTSQSEGSTEALHFFGVFDGHGGAEAAAHCAQTLHQRIAEALSAATSPSGGVPDSFSAQPSGAEPSSKSDSSRPRSRLSAEMPQHSADSGSDALAAIIEDSLREGEESPPASCATTAERFEMALTTAFSQTDEDFGKADNSALVGTTAVVALVSQRQLYVANCGDSRAVLCRGDLALPLSDDHKAAREDETARVEALGGQILFWNGVRVMGVLAVSRAIGDHCLRPFVIAQPEVTIVTRRAEDDLLLLASDGLWDVLSNQEACTLAKRCLKRARQRGAGRQSAARIAATVLTRAAIDRGSRDNVTVVVVDLTSGDRPEGAEGVQSESEGRRSRSPSGEM